MKLTFLGAAREVAGSRFLLNACGKNIMVDYGMEQGVDLFENSPLPIMESQIDCVLVTHAHIDHTGYLPLLYKNGFSGPIYATETTCDLCRIMLQDSAHIQESDAEWKTRKNQRKGLPAVEPLYTQEHALKTHALFKACRYNENVEIFPGISIRMVDVGHLMGSASIEVTVNEDGKETVIVFSGDIGNLNQPLLRDPQYMQRADYVVMESTYGDRSHGTEQPDYVGSLTKTLQETFDRGGNLIIPSFAVGRTQEMLYFIREIKQKGLVKGHDGFPVYVDSPLGIEATNVLNENTLECADEETMALIKAGVNPIQFDGLRIAKTADESKLINEDPTPKVIISASGMCEAGRIRHHLKHNLWRPESTILFVGYQAVGTLGRSLVDGVSKVKLFGETIQVAAHIEQLAGKSGHADNNGLLKWVSSFDPQPKHVFVVHGDDEVAGIFAERLVNEKGISANAPYNGESWQIIPSLEKLADGNQVRLKKPKKEAAAMDAAPKSTPPVSPKTAKSKANAQANIDRSSAYGQLLTAAEKFNDLISRMATRSSNQQHKLTKQLHALMKRFR